MSIVSIRLVLLSLLYFALNIQILTVKGLQFENPFFFKIYHIVTVLTLAALVFVSNFKLKLLKTDFLIFIAFAIFQSVFLYTIQQTYNSLVINYVFILVLIITGFQFNDLESKSLIKSLRISAGLIFLIIFVKNILLYNELLTFIRAPFGHPQIPYIYGGGGNLEATWMVINSSLFIGTRKRFYTVILISLFTSILYASRVGIILSFVALFFHLFLYTKSRKEILMVFTICFIPLTVFLVLHFDLIIKSLYILERFSSVGKDVGSTERLLIWKAVIPAIQDNLFLGHGAGNSIKAVNPYLGGFRSVLDNLHNYYLQVTLDFGFVGLILFLSSIILFVRYNWVSKNILKYAFYLYLIGALIQFRGAEPIIWFLYSLSINKVTNE